MTYGSKKKRYGSPLIIFVVRGQHSGLTDEARYLANVCATKWLPSPFPPLWAWAIITNNNTGSK